MQKGVSALPGIVAVTDYDWFRFLRSRPGIDEVNFWLPGAQGVTAQPGTPWFFKLKSPHNAIAGGGIFTHYARMPAGMAWETFGVKNGAETFLEFATLVARNAKAKVSEIGEIGCVMLAEPFFLNDADWIAPPSDWSRQIVSRKTYDLSTGVGAQLRDALFALEYAPTSYSALVKPFGGLGAPALHRPRIGQGIFRSLVYEAYSRRCAITGERTFPALEAAHIKPFSLVGAHEIDNGLLLRSDIHRLFDQGYVSVDPEKRFRVSKKIREEFENGRDYYALDKTEIRLPADRSLHPRDEYLAWHYEELFKG